MNDSKHTEIDFPIDCTGDVCRGDEIRFTEAVFEGSRRKPTFAGERTIAARVEKECYGSRCQQHTFSLLVLASGGVQPVLAGQIILRKGRNIYRNGCRRRPWADEADRKAVLREKHDRGDVARRARDARRNMSISS